MTASTARNVFTVPPGRPFLHALAEAVLAGDLPARGGRRPAKLDLPAVTVLLPTRRAARALADAFLGAAGIGKAGGALLLPAIRPIAEANDDESLIAALATAGGSEALELPPAVDPLARRLVLTELVLAWSRKMRDEGGATHDGERGAAPVAGAETPAQAAQLALDLARLMDTVETEGVPFDRLSTLVPDTFSEHWQKTLSFLEIVTRFWPAYLAEQEMLSPMDRRNRLILAEAKRIAELPPGHPVIVAGVTGSIPATAELMRAVLARPDGAIVLPALDRALDAASWATLSKEHPSHPQHGFAKLLERLGIERSAVGELAGAPLAADLGLRNRLVAEALRPTGSTAHWLDFIEGADTAKLAAGLAGVSLVEAPTAEDEAEMVALILREALETPGRTAALVSPDRLLARRVAVRLEGWGIRVDDSAGRPFAKTVPGTFLDLVIKAWSSDFAPSELMSLLKHPLTRLGLPAGRARRGARLLELAALRQPVIGRGLASLVAALQRARLAAGQDAPRHPALRRMDDPDWTAAEDLVARLDAAFAPLVALASREPQPLARFVAAHARVAEAIAEPAPPAERPAGGEPSPETVSPVWHEEAGAVAAELFARLSSETLRAPPIGAADYPDFYRALIAGETVRVRIPVHPRLFIWGPFEARLQQTDVMVLASLNEGTWPKAADPGAWLNRPMRAQLGLPSPEEEIGRAAHDVVTFLGARQVVLTRGAKVDGVPTVASRWLLRLKALIEGGLKLGAELEATTPWLAWARARDHVGKVSPVGAPAPKPPVGLRPRRASVTDVETWMKNPYAIFAKRILRLEPLPALGSEPGPAEKGQVVHDALSRFTARFPDALPTDIEAEFRDCVREAIRHWGEDPRVAAFWLPRLARFGAWFAETEPARRQGVTRIVTEVDAKLIIPAPHDVFTLVARADRIDMGPAGLVITDYKTGQVPPDGAVRSGLAPQLPLEAEMARQGAFANVPAGAVASLRYIRATGGEPPGVERAVGVKGTTVADIAAEALRGVARLVADFDRPDRAYEALRRPRFNYDYDDYAHLARILEWGGAAGEDAEGGA